MKIFISILIGYLLGSLSPAALILKLKRKNPDSLGKRNLGATNIVLNFGKKFGAIVMIFDIAKAFLAVWCARWIAPETEWLTLLVGLCAVVGHCFPFYLKFKGGKGLAAFAGVILAYDPLFFVFLLITGAILVLIANRGTAITYYAALLFPIFTAITGNHILTTVFSLALSLFMMIIFLPDLKKAIKGQDFKVRDFIIKQLRKEK